MRHAYPGEGTDVDAEEDDGRLANLVGALLLAAGDRQRTAVDGAAPGGASAPAALVALAGFAAGSSVDALSHILDLSHSGTVRLVDRLSAAGLVRRDRGDRSLSLTLTPEGRAAAEAVAAARRRALLTVLEPLDAAQRRTLVPLLERLLGGLSPDGAAARRTCRLCDAVACGHDDGRCPVTNAAAGRPA
jgi:MarR family transcriptional regulator, negative regulator of the multidrug operon emrRAB